MFTKEESSFLLNILSSIFTKLKISQQENNKQIEDNNA